VKSLCCIIGDEKELKILRSIEPFTNEPKGEKMKTCVNCGKLATQIATFDVDRATVIERYCDNCIESVK
jgi:hypothetical protein